MCCGSGIVRVYDFLRTYRAGGEEKPDLDPAGVTDAALDGTCDLCVEAVDIFLRILGAEAANLALKCLATGGVYVAGGIPPRLMKIIGEDGGPLYVDGPSGRARTCLDEKGWKCMWGTPQS